MDDRIGDPRPAQAEVLEKLLVDPCAKTFDVGALLQLVGNQLRQAVVASSLPKIPIGSQSSRIALSASSISARRLIRLTIALVVALLADGVGQAQPTGELVVELFG